MTHGKAAAIAVADHCFVVPAYGSSPFLADCLASLAAQSRPSRIAVATSTPNPAIAEAAAAVGATLHINPARDGIGADWNFALDAADARYVTLAHQDDRYAPDFLARTLALFARHRDGALAFTGYREITDEGHPRDTKITRAKSMIRAVTIGDRERVSGRRLAAFLAFGNPLPCSSVTFDRDRLAGFAFSGDLESNLDWEAWLRLGRDGHVFLQSSQPLVDRRYNALTETSRLIQNGRRAQEDRAMFDLIWPASMAGLLARLYRAGY